MSWWREAVVYEVYVRSFADSDGDGIGDLEGVRRRLPHLVSLGVDALWLTPFYPSPMADHGYDVEDPMAVDPLFGTLAGFDTLVSEAHAAGLKVIVDVVPNHTSSAHPWFREALAEPRSPLRSRYVFRPGRDGGPPNNWRSVFGGPAWTQVPDGDWYLHLFDPGQPDLDWTSPEVHGYWEDVLRFWLDRGVDGFRIDVAHGLYKRSDLADEPDPADESRFGRSYVWDRDEVLAVYEQWRLMTLAYRPERVLVGEVFLYDVDRVAQYTGPARLHQAFTFTLTRTAYDAAELQATVERALAVFDPPTWVLSNHDLVRHTTRYGGGPLGVRRGLSVTALLLALPGSTYLYQGEELGLEQADLPVAARTDPVFRRTGGSELGRDGSRTPMPWSAREPGLGFSTGVPWLPFGTDAARKAVDREDLERDSTLKVYRRLLHRRRELLPRLGSGVTWRDAPPGVLVMEREGGLVAVFNAAAEPVEIGVRGKVLEATGPGASSRRGVLTVPQETCVWVQVG